MTLIQIENIASDIEKQLKDSVSQEIESIKIGEMVMDMLKSLDKVSYVRFASVYREFTDVTNFLNFLQDGNA